jgi:hypothetical protein
MKKPTVKQSIFYSLVFLTGFVYQPNWVYENFWSKADFYESHPFVFPYVGFLLIYSSLQTTFATLSVKLIKKHL